ncbi:hypothetical protein EDE08_101374 [Bradyrhizobium sp. R2.2-H]|nr:hypothetical protein EDE10_101375 [Bradyrhizobium sp. Y-H1]TCU80676.1 hypothetical protein EDE08_101374 [Bradyrhizobium sp. R2.2-H]
MARHEAPGSTTMNAVRGIISTAPEIFLLLSMALGTVLGRIIVACTFTG